MRLFTDSSSMELFAEGKSFFAENKPLVGESNLIIIEVKDSVKLDIQYERDGVIVYKVEPDMVMVIGTEGQYD